MVTLVRLLAKVGTVGIPKDLIAQLLCCCNRCLIMGQFNDEAALGVFQCLGVLQHGVLPEGKWQLLSSGIAMSVL